jgi:hypothetical protein
MKKNIYIVMVVLFIVGIVYFIYNKNSSVKSEEYVVDSSDFIVAGNHVANLPVEELNADEINGLLTMREEEKLAHDVYITLYNKWKLNVFQNISKSELTHTEAVKYLIERYKLEDPVKDSSVGVFTNKEFTDLYKKLVEKGNISLLDALQVGATIEDLDIKDLKNHYLKTDNQDIKVVYDNLERGSRNHMRAFSKQIERNGGKYIAQYLTQEEIYLILSSPQEKGIQ